ncbi:Phage integrase family protein [Halogranum rubrum]|uniref:Phage integrase family protein n=2 Tax=Halogranum rubrum TaxID=553466 RepID=A0A1I4FUZ1_9EURY|nr:Phage integrase family protein [Halogranum rubrum]
MEGFETFLRVKKSLSSKTVSQHVTMAKAFLQDVETLAPTDVHVMKFREEMIDEGYSNSHINNTQNAIEYYFEHAGRMDELGNYSSLPRHCGDPEPLSEEELEMFVTNTTKLRDEALVLFLSSSGVRASAAVNLEFRDVDLDEKTAEITEAKGHTEYTAIFSDECAEVLERYRNVRNADADDPVFESRTGNRLTRNGLLQVIKRIGDRAGIENVYTHRFRASFANRIQRNGGDIYQIKELMGHRDIRSTVRYLKMDKDELREEHENLLNSISSNSGN